MSIDLSTPSFRMVSELFVLLDFHLLLGELFGISDQFFSFYIVFLSNMANAVLIFTTGGYVQARENMSSVMLSGEE